MYKLDHILIIDDDKISYMLSKIVLEDADISDTVTFCQTVAEALDFLYNLSNSNEASFPDLILLDVNMPNQNGFDFLEQYHQLGYHHRHKALISLYTSNLQQDYLERVKKYETIVGVTSKPLTLASLNSLLTLQAS